MLKIEITAELARGPEVSDFVSDLFEIGDQEPSLSVREREKQALAFLSQHKETLHQPANDGEGTLEFHVHLDSDEVQVVTAGGVYVVQLGDLRRLLACLDC